MIDCPACSYQNPDNAGKCARCGTRLEPPPTPRKTRKDRTAGGSLSPGDLIANRYRVIGKLGEGGMGVVYRVKDTRLADRMVALKMIHPDLVRHPEAYLRFKEEVITCLELDDHPNVIRVYDFRESDGHPFFTMECLEGRSLREIMDSRKSRGRTPPFRLDEALAVMDQLLEALAHAHPEKIHRDIKPENIMIVGAFPDVQVKVLDFGIAKTLTPSQFTRTAHTLGTAYYMAPEQRRGEAAIDHRADLYAAGMVLYEMLTGDVAEGFPDRPSAVNPGLPGAVDDIVIRLLKQSPDDRFSTAEEAREALNAAVREPETGKPRRLLTAVLLMLLLATAGAAWIYFGGTFSGSDLTVVTHPPGAAVFVDGRQTGLSPVTVRSLPAGTHGVRIALDRYAGHTENIRVQRRTPYRLETTLAPLPLGDLEISSTPAGAEIAVDGENPGRKTPALIENLPEGSRTVTLKLEGFDPWSRTVEIAPLKTARLTAGLVPIYGGLEIDSTPARAEVYIDGESFGRTPLAVDRVKKGRRTVRIKMTGYAEWNQAVNVAAGKTAEVSAKLARSAGSLAVRSKPEGAEVFIGGDLMGTTPLKIDDLAPGLVSVVVRKKCRTPGKKPARIEASKTTTLAFDLSESCGTLKILSDPTGAQGFVNGEVVGHTPVTLNGMQQGAYRIEVRHSGYKTKTSTTRVLPGKTARVEARLDPNPGTAWTDPVTGMGFVRVPGGCFQMGSPDGEKGRDTDEGPVHEVCVDGFWMGKTEVTNAQFRKFRSGHDSKEYEGHSLNGADQPVVYVSWEDAKAYVKWLNGRHNGRFTFRLPTEAEWEYACRAGTTTARFWGDDADDACRYGNVADRTAKQKWSNWTIHDCDDGYAVTAPTGGFKPNQFGLHDTLGNVWEWCEDIYSEDAYGKHQRNNPIYTGGGARRVLRGGSWRSEPGGVRCAYRDRDEPGYRSNRIGFGLLRTD